MAQSTHQVFLSHSSQGKDFVKDLYRRLTRDGVTCFFDIESIGWGDNWVRALERAIDECPYIVFVLSPDFCNSEWVEVERTSSLADDPAALKRKVRPLLLRPCRDLPTLPRFLRQVQAIDVSSGALFEQNYPRICRELGGVPRDDFNPAARSTLPPTSLWVTNSSAASAPFRTSMTRSSATPPPSFRVPASLPEPAASAKPSSPSNMPIALAGSTRAAPTGSRPISA